MPVRLDPTVVVPKPAVTPARPAFPATPITAPEPARRGDAFDTTRPRADGSLLVGKRTGGPGEVTLSKAGELLRYG